MMMRRRKVDPFIPVNQKRRTRGGLNGRRYMPTHHGGQSMSGLLKVGKKVHKSKRPPIFRRPVKQQVIDDVRPYMHSPSVPRVHVPASQAERLERIKRKRRLRRLGLEVLIVIKRAEESQELKKVRSWPLIAQGSLLIFGAVAVGLFIETLVFGELVIAAYGIFALIKRVNSRTTFMLALIALGSVVLLLILRGGESDLSDNFAVYAFLLLVVGTISLGVEVRREAKE